MSYLTSSQVWGLLTRLKDELASVASSVTLGEQQNALILSLQSELASIDSYLAEEWERQNYLHSQLHKEMATFANQVSYLSSRFDLGGTGTLVLRWFETGWLTSESYAGPPAFNAAYTTITHNLGLTSSMAICQMLNSAEGGMETSVTSDANQVSVKITCPTAGLTCRAMVLVVGFR